VSNIKLLEDIVYTLQPLEVKTFHKEASFLVLLENSGEVLGLAFDNASFVTEYFPRGIGYKMPQGEFFKKVTFTNNSATEATTFRFYFGTGEIVDGRVTIVNTVNVKIDDTTPIRVRNVSTDYNVEVLDIDAEVDETTCLLAARLGRTSGSFRNVGTESIFVANAVASVATPTYVNGWEVKPNTTFPFNHEKAVIIIRGTGLSGTQIVQFLEEF